MKLYYCDDDVPLCTSHVTILILPVAPLTASTITLQVLTAVNELEMWGDGMQTRSFTFIDDCVEGILRITKSDFKEPLNLGSTEMVSMNEMMEMVRLCACKVLM